MRRLSVVIKAINGETKIAPPIVTRKVDTSFCPFASVKYLYQPGELEGGGIRRATDPIWYVDVHKIDHSIITRGIPAQKGALLVVPGDAVNSHMRKS